MRDKVPQVQNTVEQKLSMFLLLAALYCSPRTVESVYQLNKDAMATEDETGNAVQMSLLSICASFAKYFSTGNADPQKDMLLFTNCTLLLTDEEFAEYLSEINQVTVKYMKQASSESSKTRRITLISAPTNE